MCDLPNTGITQKLNLPQNVKCRRAEIFTSQGLVFSFSPARSIKKLNKINLRAKNVLFNYIN